jgi:UDP-N-acetylmuramate-alanine ligase
VIHIAGTNGKGSTLAMIRAGLEGRATACTPIPRRIWRAFTNASGWPAS